MTTTHRARLIATASCIGVAVGFALGMLVHSILDTTATDTGRGSGEVAVETIDDEFTVSGDLARSVSPGVLVPLDLTISNPHESPMGVTDVRVIVTEVNAPNADVSLPCSIADFTVEQVATDFTVTIDADATATLSELNAASTTWPRVGMLDSASNQDGCKGASLVLAYTASGRLDK